MRLILRYVACLSLVALLAACGKSPENPAPAATTVPAAASAAAPVASTAPTPSAAPAAVSAAPVSSAPVATTVASAAAATHVPAATTAASPGTTAAPAAASGNGPEIAGSVALAEGSVTDTAKDGSVRQLKDGDDVYPGDSFVLGDASYLDLDLEDTGRILLRPNTTFQIVSYHYEPEAHQASVPTDAQGQPLIKPQQPENSFFKLIKGGLRAIDGDIGHTSPQNYGVETPVATIGVRGTAFDVRYCGDDCADEADASGKPDNGLYTSVSEGAVGIKNDSGETVTKAGQSGFVKSRKEKLQALSTPPKALRHMGLPDKLKARAQKNRGQIRVRRQQRRQQVLERRHQAAQQAKPATAVPAKTPQERRELRQEEKRGDAQQAPAGNAQRRPQLEQHREQGQQKQTAAPGKGKPAAAGQGSAQGKGLTPRERRQQQRQERLQQQREQKPQGQAAPAAKAGQQPAAKENKQGEGRCKGKRKKGKKCGG